MLKVKNNSTRLLSQYVYNLKYDDLPASVVDYTKMLILDFLASAIAGYRINGTFNRVALDVYRDMGGKTESTVLFGGGRLPAPHAAFLNAVFGHGADLDDGHRSAQGHPGVATIPAALSLAEAYHKHGKEIITAIVAGYEVYIRLSNAVMPSHFQRGFHGTGTIGTVAAGAVSAKILGLSEDAIRRSISLATVQTAGLFEVTESGQMAKPINPGNAVRTGIVSALLSKAGSGAPESPLEGRKGFFRAFSDQANVDLLLNGLGHEYKITTCYVKLYPACRHIHAPIDVARKLRGKSIPALEQIEKVRIYIYPAAIQVTGNILEPVDVDEAKFSLTYATAVALLNGTYTLDDLEAVGSMKSDVRDWIRKMEIVSEPALENRAENIRGARIEIIKQDGSVLSDAVVLPKGDPEVPLDEMDLRNKLRSCAQGIVAEETQQRIYDCVMKLEELNDISELLSLLENSPAGNG